MSVAERGPGRMTYAKKKIKPFAEHDLRVTLQCAGKKPFAEHLRVTLQRAGNYSGCVESCRLGFAIVAPRVEK